MKALGGLKEVLQLMSNHNESNEQPEPTPTPKGYGTVRFPHLLGHPGFVMVVVVEVVVLVVVTDVAGVNVDPSVQRQAKVSSMCMFSKE